MTTENKQTRDCESVPSETLAFCSHYSASSLTPCTHSCQSFWHLYSWNITTSDDQTFTISLPASHVFKIFHWGTVCCARDDQSSHFIRCLSWIFILHGGRSLLPWFEMHSYQSCKTALKMFGAAYFWCLGKKHINQKQWRRTENMKYVLLRLPL